MGLRVTPPKSAGNQPHIPPLDGSPPDGWARPYPSPEGTLRDRNPFFRDNQGFSGSPQDPESQGQGQDHGQSHDRVSLRSEEPPQRLSRPPSYNDLIELSDSPDGHVTKQDSHVTQSAAPGPTNRYYPSSRGQPGGRRSRPLSGEMSRSSSGHLYNEPPAQPTRPPPPRPVQLPLREALPDVTPVPPLQRQISGKCHKIIQLLIQ